jgi:hypothetical protein
MLRDNLQRRGCIFPILPYLIFLLQKNPSKKDDVEQKNVCGKSCTFDSEKSLAFAICIECVVKAFGVLIMSLCSIPFQKMVFTHSFT